jgi:hypothetical protein
MANEQNLKPFQKGNKLSKGRPKKLPALDKLLTNILGAEDDDKSEASAIIKAMLNKAKRGDVKAATLLLERAYGKVPDKLKIDGDIQFKQKITFR